jgi:hypothetical protein
MVLLQTLPAESFNPSIDLKGTENKSESIATILKNKKEEKLQKRQNIYSSLYFAGLSVFFKVALWKNGRLKYESQTT